MFYFGEAEFLAFFLIILFGVVLVPYIFFLIQLQEVLESCSHNNRQMDSGLVWLNLIPFFNLGWIFYTITKIKERLQFEFDDRKLDTDAPDFGFSIGLSYAILSLCSIIPIIGILTAVASFVLWILYWVKMNKYSTTLNRSSRSNRSPRTRYRRTSSPTRSKTRRKAYQKGDIFKNKIKITNKDAK